MGHMNAKDIIPSGRKMYFEYHCWEDPRSGDAKLWYRTHRRITVLKVRNYESGLHDGSSLMDRCETACPLVYRIRFSDGFEGDAFEDELLVSKKSYERPDCPKRFKKLIREKG